MIEKLIETFEELKKYIFIINRKDKAPIVLQFHNDNFYHLIGLHKIKNMDSYFPTHIKSKDKRYKYIKNNTQKFNNILKNQTKEKDLLKLRISSFPNILDLLNGYNASLYNLKPQISYSLYDGDFGLMKMYEDDICCLLGLKINNSFNNKINCSPNSWMSSNRINKLVEFKRPIYIEGISKILSTNYNENNIYS